MNQRHAERREQPARLQGTDLGAPEPRLHAGPVSRQEFSAGFERCFGRVYAYVSRRVNDRETCERIVSQVMTASLDLLVGRVDESVGRVDERRELSRLKVSSDRLIGQKGPSGASTGTVEP